MKTEKSDSKLSKLKQKQSLNFFQKIFKFLNKFALFHILFVMLVTLLIVSVSRFSPYLEIPGSGIRVLFFFWLVWIAFFWYKKKGPPRKWIFSVVIGVPLLFVIFLVLLFEMLWSSMRGGFEPSEFPQGDLQAITQGKDVVNTTQYYDPQWPIPGFYSTSPDGIWKVSTEGMRYDKEMFLEHYGQKEVILHRISKSPSYWSKVYWVDGTSYLIACVEQFTSFDGPSEKTCFAYNVVDKSMSVVPDPVVSH